MASSKEIVTPIFRASFLSINEPKINKENGSEVYECTMIFSPDTDLKSMKDIVEEAVVEKWGNARPRFFKSPFRRGVWKSEEYPNGYDLEKYPEYEGNIIAAARSYNLRPGVVDANCQAILDPKELYSGLYARARIVAYGYDNAGGIGVAFGLRHFQKCYDGDNLSANNGKPEDAFEAFIPPSHSVSHDDLLGI